MSLNYFAIMEAADKEMVHSAMLRFLLHNAPPVLALFSRFAAQGGDLQVSLEVVCKAGNSKRERFDLVARSGSHTLIVENKFKSFPTAAQLARYDSALRGAEGFPNPVKYLLCFDAAALAGEGAKTFVATKNAEPWHILDYEDILGALANWLESGDQNIAPETRIFSGQYSRYLAAYYKSFREICKDCRLALCSEKEQHSAREAMDKKADPSAGDAALPARDPNFWQTLILHQVGLVLKKRLIDKLGDIAVKAAAQDRLIIHSKGVSATPNVNVQPPDWPGANGKKPSVCIQVQGREMKLYIYDLDGTKPAAREAALAYARKLREILGDEGKVSDAMMQSHAGRSNSFSAYKDGDSLFGGGKTGIGELADRIWQFYERMDAAVKEAGPLFP